MALKEPIENNGKEGGILCCFGDLSPVFNSANTYPKYDNPHGYLSHK
jgi:hypothetical protein